jgi:hypothetical protein
MKRRPFLRGLATGIVVIGMGRPAAVKAAATASPIVLRAQIHQHFALILPSLVELQHWQTSHAHEAEVFLKELGSLYAHASLPSAIQALWQLDEAMHKSVSVGAFHLNRTQAMLHYLVHGQPPLKA